MYTCKYIIIYGPVLVHIYTYQNIHVPCMHIYIYAYIRVSYIYLQYTCISLYHTYIYIYYTYVSKSIVQEIPGKELPDSAGSTNQAEQRQGLQPIHVLRQVLHGKDQPSIGAIVKFLHEAAMVLSPGCLGSCSPVAIL